MKEVLFRGKGLDEQWVEGYYLVNEYHNVCIRTTELIDGEMRLMDNVVYPETVGQYINLQDKNGEKIFSNSKIKDLTDGKIYEIEYHKGRYSLKGWYNPHYDYPSEAFSEGMSDFEIVED